MEQITIEQINEKVNELNRKFEKLKDHLLDINLSFLRREPKRRGRNQSGAHIQNSNQKNLKGS